jgi:hypothetical protein
MAVAKLLVPVEIIFLAIPKRLVIASSHTLNNSGGFSLSSPPLLSHSLCRRAMIEDIAFVAGFIPTSERRHLIASRRYCTRMVVNDEHGTM